MWIAPCALIQFNHTTGHSPTWNISTCANDNEIQNQTEYVIGIMLASLSGISSAIRYELLHSVKDIPTATWNLWLTFGGTLICLSGALFEPFTLPTRTECIVYFLCIVFLAYNLLSPYSLQYIPPYVYSLIKSQQLVVSFLLQTSAGGMFMRGKNNWVEYVGAVCCMLACIAPSIVNLFRNNNSSWINGGYFRDHILCLNIEQHEHWVSLTFGM